MPKITALYAYIIADKDENDEGVPAIMTPYGAMPLVGADLDRVNDLRQFAQEAADTRGKPIKLIRSTGIEIVEEIQPNAK